MKTYRFIDRDYGQVGHFIDILIDAENICLAKDKFNADNKFIHVAFEKFREERAVFVATPPHQKFGVDIIRFVIDIYEVDPLKEIPM